MPDTPSPATPTRAAQTHEPTSSCDGAGPRPPSRRAVLRGAAAVGVVAGTGALLVACGSTSTSTSSSGAGSDGSSGGGGATLGPAADVEVGGGVIYRTEQVVVTQPSAGVYHGFSAVCTHQGCLVSSVTEGAIVCNCHGSHYSITDGSVLSGPAPAPLAAVDVTVDGGDVILDA